MKLFANRRWMVTAKLARLLVVLSLGLCLSSCAFLENEFFYADCPPPQPSQSTEPPQGEVE